MAKRTSLKMWGVVLVFLFGLQFVTVAAGDVIYVDDDGSTMVDAAGFRRDISEDGTITAIHPGRVAR